MNRLSRFIIPFTLLLALFCAPLLLTTGGIAGNYGDVYLHYYPLRHLVAEQLNSGSMPLWNPYIFGGQPLLANPQSAVFYPGTLLFFFLPLPAAFNYFIVSHLFLGGFFFYLLLRFYRLSHTGSLTGSIAFAFSSFLIYKIPAGHPAALSGYVWLPAIVLALEKLARSPGALWTALFPLALLLQFLSGHTQPFATSLVFIAAHFLAHRCGYWRRLLAAGACFLVFAAVQLLPTAELSRHIESEAWPALVEAYSLPLKNLVNLLLPDFFGNVRDGSYIFPDRVSYFFERHALYIGIIPLLLALYGFGRALRERRLFYPALALTGLFLALGFSTPLYRWLYGNVPGLSFLRVPARFSYLMLFALLVLAVRAWDRRIAGNASWIKALLIVLIAGDLFRWGHRFIYAESMRAYRRPSEISAVAAGPLYRIVTQPDRIPSNKSMLYHHHNLNGYEAILLKDFTRYLGLQERRVLSTTGLARYDIGSPLVRGLATAYAVTFDRHPGLEQVQRLASGLSVYRLPDPLPRVFFADTVRAIADGNGQIEYLRRTSLAPDREIVVDAVPDGFPRGTGGGRIDSFTPAPNRVTAELVLTHPGILVFGDIFYPGWRAWADGRAHRIQRGNRALRTLFLSSGDYRGARRVILVYRPASFLLGLWITLLGWIIVIIVVSRRNKSNISPL